MSGDKVLGDDVTIEWMEPGIGQVIVVLEVQIFCLNGTVSVAQNKKRLLCVWRLLDVIARPPKVQIAISEDAHNPTASIIMRCWQL